MIRNVIKAGLLCVSFGNVAQAGTDMPDFPNDVTPETAYSVLDSNPSCLLASEALNPDSLNLTEDQQVLVDLTEKITSTELGRTIVQKNASDNVFYCFWNDENDNPQGKYYWDFNVAAVFDKGVSDTGDYLPTAVEEFAHAAQFHTDDNPINKLDEVNLYGKYLTGMMVEAQAKIWKEQILYEYRENKGVPHPTHSDEVNVPAAEMAHQCFLKYNGEIHHGCLENAFNAMLENDNGYTGYTLNAIMSGDFGPKGQYDVCNMNAQKGFGYILQEEERIYFLSSDYNVDDVIDFYRDEKPERGQFNSWQYPTILRYKDGTIDFDTNAKPIRKASYSPSCLPT